MKRRVVSKNLFNYISQGKLDEDINKNLPVFDPCLSLLNIWTAYKFVVEISKYLIDLAISKYEWNTVDFEVKNQPFFESILIMWKGMMFYRDEEFVRGFRMLCNYGFDVAQSHVVYEKTLKECNHSELKVKTTHLGDYSVPVLVHTPNRLMFQSQRPAIVYAHGGGVIGGSASTHKRYLSKVAVRCNVVVFNVDYRRAPETKCPNNILDFYEVLKYVHCKAELMGIDASRIAIAGESGGGYICLGTMILLSQRHESNLVKLAMPNVPMVDDDSLRWKDPGIINIFIRKVWALLAEDLREQENDPLLFPGKASDEILENVPPTIMWEAEFDIFLNEATRLANRIDHAGRLLELVVFPGQRHGSWINPRFKCHEKGFDAYSLAVEKYLIE